jgi:O-antigen/teichoic acid export membrane protein
MTTEQTGTPGRSTRHGWLWGGADQVFQRGIALIVGFVLARLLDPSAYGLIASVSLFTGFAFQIIDSGIGQRVLQKPRIGEEDYGALFWCNAAVSLFCVILLVALSATIARFLREPHLQPLVVALAGVVFMMNAGRTQETLLIREQRFRSVSLIRMASTIAGSLVGLAMAAAGCGVWSLVGQMAVMASTKAAALWILVPWRPPGRPSLAAVKDLYGFGLPVMLAQLAVSCAEQFSTLLIAKRTSVTMLGFYDRGRILPQNLGYSVSNISSQTNFPALARLQHDPPAFRDAYLRFLHVTAALVLMVLAGVAVCAEDIIAVALGARWLPSVWFLRASCVLFSFYVVRSVGSEAVRAKGKTGAFFRLSMAQAGLSILGSVAGMPYGVKGIVVGHVLAYGVACALWLVRAGQCGGIRVTEQIRVLQQAFVGVGAMVALLLGIELIGLPLWIRFPLSAAAGGGAVGLYWWLRLRKQA